MGIAAELEKNRHPGGMDGRYLDRGVAGASGRRKHEQRSAKRKGRAPGEEATWATGAVGEEILAAYLDRRFSDAEAIVLHDRRMPGGFGNIDHLAITPSGVHVIDAKRYKGEVRVRRPFLFGEARLVVGGRDQTTLVGKLARQVKAVRSAVGSAGLQQAPVHGCFCFVDPQGHAGGSGGLPLLRTQRIEGYPLLSPRKLARRLKRQGELGPEQRLLVAKALARRFPAA